MGKGAILDRWIPWTWIVLAVLAGFLVLLAGPAYRFRWLDLGQAFGLMGFGALAAVVISGLALANLLVRVRSPQARWRCLVALVIAAPAFLGPWSMKHVAGQVPPIHDISTDLGDPPALRAAARLRGPGAHSVAYPGGKVAEQQRRAYPDIQPVRLEEPAGAAFDDALAAARGMGWRIVARDRDAGRIEAVATTLWWGFKDDVAVRVRSAEGGGSRIDVRSASRVGVSDLGKNAERIRAFEKRLKAP